MIWFGKSTRKGTAKWYWALVEQDGFRAHWYESPPFSFRLPFSFMLPACQAQVSLILSILIHATYMTLFLKRDGMLILFNYFLRIPISKQRLLNEYAVKYESILHILF
jgi:hypothetical protein